MVNLFDSGDLCSIFKLMKKIFIFILILLLAVLGLLFCVKNKHQVASENNVNNQMAGDSVVINFLDVGQGDASLINFPDGEQMLVDCSEDARILEALGRVMDFYDNEINYLLITHPDSDHYGGCEEVLNRFKVRNVIYTGFQKNGDSAWDALLARISHDPNINYLKIEGEQTLNIASTSLHFLYPDHSLEYDPKIPNLNSDNNAVNNSSIVFELNYLGKEALFMGDASSELEEYLLKKYDQILNSDILKVGHHGSSYSSEQEFLDIVMPAYAIISVGENNKFGHPSARILKKIERTNSQILRTDFQGDLKCFLSNGVVCNS